MDIHGKESCVIIGNSKISEKLTFMPEKKEQDTKRKHETNSSKLEENMMVVTLDISDNKVNKKMKTMAKTMTTAKTKKIEKKRKGKAVVMREK